MKSKYIQEGTTNDLESIGHIETPCQVVAEFVADIVEDRGYYQFIFQRDVNFFGTTVKKCVAKLVIKDGTIINKDGFASIQQEAIGRIEYIDGWGGVEFFVNLEGGEE